MLLGGEILLLTMLAQSQESHGVPRFVMWSGDSSEREDQRPAPTNGRIAAVRPFPLFDAMNEPRPLAAELHIDIDFDGDKDLIEVSRFGRSRLFVNDGADHFAEAPLLEGREVICAARFAAFTDLDGDRRPDLLIAAPADPVGARVLASKPSWLDGLPRRVQRDAAAFVSGGVVIACSKEGRRDITESLGLSRLAPFRAGAVADFDGDGASEIVLLGGESDDMAAFWETIVPTFARVGADPTAAAAAMASLPAPKPPYSRPRLLKRGADGRFAPIPAEFPLELERIDVAGAGLIEFPDDHLPNLWVDGDDGELVFLQNATKHPSGIPVETRQSDPRSFWIRTDVMTPAPAVELTALNGQRVKLDAIHPADQADIRQLVVIRLDSVADAATAAALAAEAKELSWADVVLLDAQATDEASTRAKTAMALVSEVVAGSRAAATLFWIDPHGDVELVGGGITLRQLEMFANPIDIDPSPVPDEKPDAARHAAAVVALPRAEREAHLPNLALAALTKLESAGEEGLDFEFGLALAETRKPAEAADRFEKVARESPDYPRAQLELGRCLLRTKREGDARPAFERAVDAAPADPVARFELGRFLLSLKETDREKEKALGEAGTESLRVATYLKPDFADAQYAFGQGLARIGRHDEAITALERALALAPDAPQARPARELLASLQKKKGS